MSVHIHGRLLEERGRLRLTQQQMADAAGVKKRAYIYYEQGERSPDVAVLQRLGEAGVDIYYVVSGLRQNELIQEQASVTAAAAMDLVVDVMEELELQGKLSIEEIKTLVRFVLDHRADREHLKQFVRGATQVFRPDLSTTVKAPPSKRRGDK